MGPEILIPLVSIGGFFGVAALAIWTSHSRKIAEIRARSQGQVNTTSNAEIAALRAEVHSLRDTSMQYDLSFDTALQRMEQRMETVERRVGETPATQQVGINAGR